MRLIDIYNNEHNRTDNNIIYLYKDDKSGWMHGYEWSAYLSKYYKNGLEDDKRLKPSRRKLKESPNGIISIGLLPTSINKYFPNANIISDDKNCMQISVDIPDYNLIQDLDSTLTQWKEKHEFKNPTKESSKNFIYSHPMSFSAIMKRIIGYQLESTTPEDNKSFIRELKCMCSELI